MCSSTTHICNLAFQQLLRLPWYILAWRRFVKHSIDHPQHYKIQQKYSCQRPASQEPCCSKTNPELRMRTRTLVMLIESSLCFLQRLKSHLCQALHLPFSFIQRHKVMQTYSEAIAHTHKCMLTCYTVPNTHTHTFGFDFGPHLLYQPFPHNLTLFRCFLLLSYTLFIYYL